MSETNPDPTNVPDPASVDPTNTDTVTLESLQEQVNKWKALSRKHEAQEKANLAELETLRQAQMSDAEKAIDQAKAEGRSSALSEVGTRLATAELKAAAATAGVAIPEGLSELLDVSKLLGEDGNPDSTAITALVGSFTPTTPPPPTFSQNVGVGPQGTNSVPGQLTRDDLKRMTPTEINKARKDGLLNTLLAGG